MAGSASLGDLIISIAGDIANLELAMTRAEKLTADTAKKIDTAMDKAGESIKELAAAYVGFEAIKGFADQIDETQKYAASLTLLSQTTGVSVESLSSMKLTAEKAGVTMQQVGMGFQVLEKNARDTAAGTGRARDAFAELGVKVTDTQGHLKSGEVLMEEVAKALDKTGNATLRVADTQKILQDPALLPFLSQLAQAHEREAEVTGIQAQQAKAYTDTLAELKDTKEKFYLMISEQVTPVMTSFVKVLIDSANSADGLNGKTKQLQQQNAIRQWAIDAGIAAAMLVDGLRYVWAGIQSIGDVVAVVAVWVIEGFKNIGTAIVDAFEGAKGFVKILAGLGAVIQGNWSEGVALMKEGWGDMSNAADQFKQRFQESLANVATAADVAGQRMKDRAQNFGKGFADSFVEQIAHMNDGLGKLATNTDNTGNVIKKVQKDAVDGMALALVKQNAVLKDNYESLVLYGAAAHDTAQKEAEATLKEMERNGVLADHARKTGESVEATKKRILGLAQEKDYLTQLVQIETEYVAALKKDVEAMGSNVQKVVDQIQQQKEINATLGLGVDATIKYTIAELERQKAIAQQYDDSQNYVAALDMQIAKLKELANLKLDNKFLQDQLDGWKQLGDLIGTTATNMVTDWGHATQHLRDMLKQLLNDMLAIFAKKWALNMVADVVGSNTQLGGMLSQVASQTGQGSFAGNIYDFFSGNNASSQIGPPDMSGGAGYSDTYFNNGAAAGNNMTAGGYATGMAGGAVAGYGIGGALNQWFGNNRNQVGMSVGGAVGGALGFAAGAALGAEYGSFAGPIGMVIGAVVGALLGSLIKSGGGPKQQGFYDGTYSGTAMGSTLIGPGTTEGLFTGDNQHADTAHGITDLISSTFYQTAYELGAKSVGNMNFGFGFSQDPQGTAPGMIHDVIRDSSGNIIYQHNNDDAPRDSAQFQTEVQTETERALVAGLQHTDLGPELNDLFKSFGDVATATKADMDALLAQAQDLHSALVTIDALSKGAFGINLSLDDLKQYQQAGETLTQTANRVGGAWVNLVNQFESPMDKLNDEKANLATLYATLTASGQTIPKTREDWLNVMKSIDQSTEAGRNLFLQMMQLAPAFNDVQNAAASMMQQFDQLMGKERPGYTLAQQQSSLADSLTQFMAANGWTAGMSAQQVLEQLHTITREDFAKYDTATQQLILTILGLDDSIKGNTSAIQAAAAPLNPAYGGDAFNLAMSKLEQQFSNYSTVISGQPDTSSQITTQINVTKNFIENMKARMQQLEQQYAGYMMPAEYDALQLEIQKYSASLTALSTQLASVTVLEAQYGKQKGDQVYALQQWYEQQKALVGENNAALLALQQEYQDKLNAIISGGTADGLSSAQANIKQFLDGLLTDQSLSPLSPTEQLAAAAQHYQEVLAAAQGGDATAQGQLQQVAQQYLQLAHQVDASGPEYNAIFREVYDDLAKFADQPTYEQKMADALPAGKLASAEDLKQVNLSIQELTTVIAAGIRVSDPAVQAALDKIARGYTINGTGLFA